MLRRFSIFGRSVHRNTTFALRRDKLDATFSSYVTWSPRILAYILTQSQILLSKLARLTKISGSFSKQLPTCSVTKRRAMLRARTSHIAKT